jgi:hypothetical protein
MTDDERITEAVEKCLVVAIGCPNHFSTVTTFLKGLRTLPEWVR